MEIVHTTEVRALVELQRKDTAIGALTARAAEVPVKLAALRKAFEDKKLSMAAAKEALCALQVAKKDAELRIAEAEEGIRKHQRELNLVKENDAFKALLSEIERDKAVKDELETRELLILEEIDKAAVLEKAEAAEVKKLEGVMNSEAAALEASAAELAAAIEAAKKDRDEAAADISPDLLDKYEAIRASRAGLAVAAAYQDPATGKYSCGGCHMSLTPQKTVDIKKQDAFAVCADCRRLMFLEQTING
ncbi:MAG: hypothetical protein NDI60_02570 [Elusimicrobiales bacterium]|nr:hypothetical protein [Elusimicrobiales bacterium]